MQKLIDIGFKEVGYTQLSKNNRLEIVLSSVSYETNLLYAFVLNNEIAPVIYIGYTRNTLTDGLKDCMKAKKKTIFKKLNKSLISSLKENQNHLIFAFKNTEMMYDIFNVDLAAGLKFSLIAYYKQYNLENNLPDLINKNIPQLDYMSYDDDAFDVEEEYNEEETIFDEMDIEMSIIEEKEEEEENEPEAEKATKTPKKAAKPTAPKSAPKAKPVAETKTAKTVKKSTPKAQSGSLDTFDITLGKTYWTTAYINVPALHSPFFGEHGEEVSVELYEKNKLVATLTTKIDRKAIKTGTPRLYLHPSEDYSAWKQKNFNLGDVMTVTIVDSNTLQLRS